MKNNVTELVFILDRSGSMCGLVSDTIGGFNSLIAKQKKEEGRAYVTTVLFDTRFQRLHDRVDLNSVEPMTEKDYVPGGCTALLDAIGEAIRHIAGIHRYARKEDLPAHTVFVISTDGMENASHRFSGERVREMIRHEQEKYGWEFIFLAANIDAAETAQRYGIDRGNAVDYRPDAQGTDAMFGSVSAAIGQVRRGRNLQAEPLWRRSADEDFQKRGKK